MHLPGECVPVWGLNGCSQDCLILIPFRLPGISCFTLSLKCFSSDSASCPSVGIRPLLQFPHPLKAGLVLLTLLFFSLVPSSYWIFHGSIYSFLLVRYSCLQLVFCMHFCVWRCIPDVSVERERVHVHLLLRHLVLSDFFFFFFNLGASFVAQIVKKQICLQCRILGFDLWVTKIPWSRKWLPTPIFLPGKSHGEKSLGYNPWIAKNWRQLCD